MYQDLLNLTKTNEAFYFKDSVVNGNTYRVFMYRLAGYSDFCLPSALEARGITYLLLPNMDPMLVCRPFKKFFNLEESPFTMGLSLDKVCKVAEKADGSLISTFWDPVTNYFGVKSKQSFDSEQAIQARKLLEQSPMLPEVIGLAQNGYTVNFEYTSPLNRIVLEYPTTTLKVLGIRNLYSGELLEKNSLDPNSELVKNWVDEYSLEEFPHSIRDIPTLTGIEGFVCTLQDGVMFKLKTEWYKSLHHLKDSVSSSRRLFEAIIDETIDDVKTMFPTDEIALNRIKSMEDIVIPKFNHAVSTVEKFYEANKVLPRKEYAIKGQQDLGMLFHLGMNLYLGKDAEYKDFAKKYRKEYFGITEDKDYTNE